MDTTHTRRALHTAVRRSYQTHLKGNYFIQTVSMRGTGQSRIVHMLMWEYKMYRKGCTNNITMADDNSAEPKEAKSLSKLRQSSHPWKKSLSH